MAHPAPTTPPQGSPPVVCFPLPQSQPLLWPATPLLGSHIPAKGTHAPLLEYGYLLLGPHYALDSLEAPLSLC